MPKRPLNRAEKSAIAAGLAQAQAAIASRKKAQRTRAAALRAHAADPQPLATPQRAATPLAAASAASRGTLVAEGDSWFDYPFHSVLQSLEDIHGFDVESVAHRGDTVEAMAYSSQLADFTRRIEKVARRGITPRAILLSGGGNDMAGSEFHLLLNHVASPTPGFNEQVISGIIDDRIKHAYLTIIAGLHAVCRQYFDADIPLLLHGYDYGVPDGRGFWGGAWILPGPWLKPGFDAKGYTSLADTTAMIKALIDRMNAMLQTVAALPAFPFVRYVDLRGTLPTSPAAYKKWWDNELHPTARGFDAVAAKIAAAIP